VEKFAQRVQEENIIHHRITANFVLENVNNNNNNNNKNNNNNNNNNISSLCMLRGISL
jgi:hypothetical protein